MQVLHTVPILRIFDLAKARDFYLGYLAFQLDWEHRFDAAAPLYMQLSRGGCLLHLSEHHGDGTPGTVVFLRVRGLDTFHSELVAKNYAFLRPGIERAPWNAYVMELADPFGNRLRFSEDRS